MDFYFWLPTFLDLKKEKKEEYQNIGSTYFFHLVTPKLWGTTGQTEKQVNIRRHQTANIRHNEVASGAATTGVSVGMQPARPPARMADGSSPLPR